MSPDPPARRSPRRRPDLNVNISRLRSESSSEHALPPLSPPLPQKAPSSRASLGRGSKPPTSISTSAVASSLVHMKTKSGPHALGSAEEDFISNSPQTPTMPGQRDSHDLSLPNRHARDSLVSNMLLSLDQFSISQMTSPDAKSGPTSGDPRLYSLSTATIGGSAARAPNVPTAPRSVSGGRYRGHNNYNPKYDIPDDTRRPSDGISHTYRSNSSSGAQPNLGHSSSMRDSTSQHGGQSETARAIHLRGSKGSKSSSTNSLESIDYARVTDSQQWASGVGGRSSSSDLDHRLPGTSSSTGPSSMAVPSQQHQDNQKQYQQQPWHIEFSNSFFNETYDDAAPTPTIPGGPRKLTSVPSMPSIPSYQQPSSEAPLTPERRRSVRSSRSATVGRQSQVKLNNSAAPPLPASDSGSAPAPNIGYGKSKETVSIPGTQPLPQHPLRQKPSFFRRVFGGFRDTTTEIEPPPPLPSTPSNRDIASSSVDAESNTRSQQHSSAGYKQRSTPPSRDSHYPPQSNLQKKPSGFFRRRKKSVTEADAPPPLPMPIKLPPQPPQQPPPPPDISQSSPRVTASPLTTPADRGERVRERPSPSNVASYRAPDSEAREQNPDIEMPTPQAKQNARLDGSPSVLSRELTSADTTRRTVRGFSPDYEPPATATIRTVGPETVGIDQTHLKTPTRLPPAPPQNPTRAGSFLSDDSDSEDSPRRDVEKSLARQQKDYLVVSNSAVDDQHLSPTAHRPSSKCSQGSLQDEVDPRSSQLSLSIQEATTPDLQSATSRLAANPAGFSPLVSKSSGTHTPIAKTKDSGVKPIGAGLSDTIDEPDFVIGKPTEDDRQKALNIYEGSEDFIQKEKAAAWMGEEGPIRQRTLQAYMDLYDFRNQSIVNALREVCSRLILRAETQQVDRILVCFSKRWCTCNPNHGFKSLDVVHTICYSIMLLNTDLHLADIESKMTRAQFIKNTLTSILHTLSESAPDVKERSIYGAPHGGRRPSIEQDRNLAVSALPPRSESSLGHHDDCGPLVKAPVEGSMRSWESQMDIVLKIIYTSIRDERLPLFGADTSAGNSSQVPNQSSLSVKNMLRRTPSALSKAPSESQASLRGRVAESNARAGSSRWTSKSRSRVRGPGTGFGAAASGLTIGNGFSSSRTSFEDGNSIWSPTLSSATWSRQSLGRTQTSMSMESFGSSFGRGEYQQSIGFANALSQAIIREDNVSTAASIISDQQSIHREYNSLLDDESLELAGPPWIKEGMVVHKHHLDGMDKKARDRNWTEVFAVVQKGYMSLFSFASSKSLRVKHRSRNATVAKGAVVGGGNWQDNATNVGSFSLKQTLASALPPPGYSRQRPYVWALSLPTGAVHLFQVGTPEICREFVTTANYWSARLSTHPLVGGISNIEYGWGEGIVNNALVNVIKSESTTALPSTAVGAVGGTHGPYPPSASRPGSAAAGRVSMQSRSSFRSGSFDFGHMRSGSASSVLTSTNNGVTGGAGGIGSVGNRQGKLPGDRIHIAEWAPPTQSLRASNAAEPQQLQTLLAYVHGIENELKSHNALRSPMLLAFTPRGHNASKAMANWERKSSYLLREIVKYRTYVDCLTEAERRRGDIYLEREIARRAARGETGTASNDEDDERKDRTDTASSSGAAGKNPDREHEEDDPEDGNGSVFSVQRENTVSDVTGV
ncbi:hypothetical protein SEPCBS119000_001610 [Sporothrix epigloea]|uniref:SEC7 domain-containing protein n=1 Tax=Sporothrix epigloea TaxID=1892477 RepID=A0ABP0DBN9_9PEZI